MQNWVFLNLFSKARFWNEFSTNAEVTLSSSQSIDFFLEVVRSNLIIGKFN